MEDQPMERKNDGRFKPGNKLSAGRKKLPKEFRDIAKEAAPCALRAVIAIMKGDKTSDRDRAHAAEIVMDRAYGKPQLPLTGLDEGPIRVLLEGELEKWSK